MQGECSTPRHFLRGSIVVIFYGYFLLQYLKELEESLGRHICQTDCSKAKMNRKWLSDIDQP